MDKCDDIKDKKKELNQFLSINKIIQTNNFHNNSININFDFELFYNQRNKNKGELKRNKNRILFRNDIIRFFSFKLILILNLVIPIFSPINGQLKIKITTNIMPNDQYYKLCNCDLNNCPSYPFNRLQIKIENSNHNSLSSPSACLLT